MSKKYNNTPPIFITNAGLNMFVDTVKLRELPLSVVDIDIEKLAWHFNMPVWAKDGTDDWNLTPQEVINNTPDSLVHQRRVAKADTKFPILITEYKSRLVIIDGIHRLVKVSQNNNKTIKAKIIPSSYLFDEKFLT